MAVRPRPRPRALSSIQIVEDEGDASSDLVRTQAHEHMADLRAGVVLDRIEVRVGRTQTSGNSAAMSASTFASASERVIKPLPAMSSMYVARKTRSNAGYSSSRIGRRRAIGR
jgi:hypothetical protein